MWWNLVNSIIYVGLFSIVQSFEQLILNCSVVIGLEGGLAMLEID
jgi:hypothetical protein